MFNQVQASLPAASLKDVQRVVPKPLLSNLGWLLRVIFLLEDKPSAQFRVQRTLGQLIWSKDVSVQNSMMVPPPCFTTGMILARWWAWHFFSFAFRPKSFIFVLDRPEIFFYFSWSQSPAGAFGKLFVGCHVPFTQELLSSNPSTIQAWLVILLLSTE